MTDRPTKITVDMPRRWNGSDYEPVQIYTSHWPDGTTTSSSSCPPEDELSLIEPLDMRRRHAVRME